jgi:ribulose-bisphosphate carboxylase large chain
MKSAEPGPLVVPPDLARYARQVILPGLGVEGQRRLADARVLVLGVGALGGALASSMVRAGVGFVRIVDRDNVEIGNLQRQTLYDEEDVAAGLPKVATAGRKLARANSSVRVEAVTADAGPRNIEALVTDCSLVLDGTDNFETRLLLNDACLKHGVPWIYGAVIGTGGCTFTILPGDGPCFRCLVSSLPAAGTVPTTATAGVLGMTPQAVAALQATEAIKLLAGRRADLVRGVRFLDLWDGSFEELKVAKGPLPCPACDMARYEYLDGIGGIGGTGDIGAVKRVERSAPTMDHGKRPGFSGSRFTVSYLLTGSEAEARAKARDICYEETVELPEDLTPAGPITEHVVGRIESFQAAGSELFRAGISYAIEIAKGDLTQLLNVFFGNISMKTGVKLQSLDLPAALTTGFQGPRFGRAGLRTLVGVPHRPLTAAALKPMGFSPEELAEQAACFARGGIDLIKDDHGLVDQEFCPFEERVGRCVEAVARANRETGRNSLYAPNVTTGSTGILERARKAKSLGAGALLVVSALVGYDTVRAIADSADIGLPIIAHPSFGGSFVTSPNNGISHGVLYGQLVRLAGADISIFPNFGGRFSFTREECIEIARSCSGVMGSLKTIFASPAGGMTLDRVKETIEVYGRELVFLMGGGLHRRGPDLAENARYFTSLLESAAGSLP